MVTAPENPRVLSQKFNATLFRTTFDDFRGKPLITPIEISIARTWFHFYVYIFRLSSDFAWFVSATAFDVGKFSHTENNSCPFIFTNKTYWKNTDI